MNPDPLERAIVQSFVSAAVPCEAARSLKGAAIVFRFTRGVCLVLCSGFILNAADPAWYSQPQFFDTYSFYTYNVDPLLRQIPFTGQAWGYGFTYPVPAAEISGAQTEIAAWNGKPFFAYLNLDAELAPMAKDLLSEWDPFRRRTIDGSYL